MFKGFLSGSILGTIVSAAAVLVMSVLSGPVVSAPEPPKDTVEQPQDAPIQEQQSLVEPSEVLAPSLGDARSIAAPTTDGVAGAVADTTSGTRPVTGNVGSGVDQPEVASMSQVAAIADVEPVLPNPQAMAPSAPGVETTPQLDTTPAVLPEPVAPVALDVAPSDGVQTELPSLDTTDESSPVVEVAEPEEIVETLPVETVEVAPVLDVTQPEAEVVEAPAVAPEAPEAVVVEAPVEAPQVPQDTPEVASTAEEPTAPRSRLALSSDTGNGLTDRAVGVKVNRLGQGDAAGEGGTDSAEPAIERFAVSFENPEQKPLISVVLIDDGRTNIGPEALQSFPYPLTFAVDAATANGAERAASYRKAGFEVMFIGALPQGAVASDVEVALEAYKTAVPEAVGMLELGTSDAAAGPQIVAQTVSNLKETGHGLLTMPSGFNSVNRVADRADVPNTVVFRDLDGEGQDATIIRRFLDQAAFKAAQSDGLVLLGRLQPNTVSALILWGGLDRAKRVALAPVSAILNKAAPE